MLASLLRSWARHAHSSHIGSTVPWWLEPCARIDSVVRAAQALGWTATNTYDVDDSEGWDAQIIVGSTATVVVRLIAATVVIDKSNPLSSTISDAWRVLALMAPPPNGAIGWHLVCVGQHLENAEDDIAVRTAMDAWLTTGSWGAAYDPKVWTTAQTPFPRNATGVAFPGVGLIGRIVMV